jgi:hypothetical protein
MKKRIEIVVRLIVTFPLLLWLWKMLKLVWKG